MTLPLPAPSDPDFATPRREDPAILRAALAAAERDPWLASLFMRRLGALRGRLAELREWLASAPRRMRRSLARRWVLAAPSAALLLALAIGQARAATITVDLGGSGCTLADAITAANTDTATGSCPAGSGPDSIGFASANGTYSLSTNYAGVPLPDITTAVTIQGNGNTTLDAEGDFGVLRVTGGGSLALSNATITGGSTTAGGGIYVRQSTLSVVDATVSGNTASVYGGGIRVYNGLVTLTRTTVSGNTAATFGGGIYADNGSAVYVTDGSMITGNAASVDGGGINTKNGSVHLRDATVSGNSAYGGGGIAARYSVLGVTRTTISSNTAQRNGGGIMALASAVIVTHSAISGNSAGPRGGGIYIRHNVLTVTNATISGNSAGGEGGGVFEYESSAHITHASVTGNSAGGAGAGLRVLNSSMYIQNSIVAGQSAGTDCSSAGGALISEGYNIESATSCGFTSTGDQQNVSNAALNLGPLAPNPPGGTRTHALGKGSAALDQIPASTNGCGTTITADQRGVARPQFGSCDVGAYELAPEDLNPPSTRPPTAAEVVGFGAAPDPTGRIRVAWETASEVDVAGFRVERAAAGGAWAAVGDLVPARGGAAGGSRYVVADAPGIGSFSYRLLVLSADGPPAVHGPATAIVRALRAFLPLAMFGRQSGHGR